MKKLNILLAIITVLFLTACAASDSTGAASVPTEPITMPTATETVSDVTEEVSSLRLDGLRYTESGLISDFEIEGTLSSNYDLDEIQWTLVAICDAPGGQMSISDDLVRYHAFPPGVRTFELAVLTERMEEELLEVCSLIGMIGELTEEGGTLVLEMAVTCNDVSGNTVEFTVRYTVSTG